MQTLKKILSIGAHPDDVEIGMAGTILKHNAKDQDVHILPCTLGGVSGDPVTRREEAQEAAHILDAELHILDYPVSKLNRISTEFVREIKKIVEDINPDRVYTHSPYDYHQIHVTVSEAVLRASKDINQILFYEYLSSTTPEFNPDAFVDITEHIGLKIKSIEAHKSQSNRTYMHPNIARSLANTRYVWGKVGKNPNGMAEAFVIYKYIL